MPTLYERYRMFLRDCSIVLERCQGLDFSAIVDPEEVGLDPMTAHRSSPSGGRFLAKVFKKLGITPEDAIIDIGCGKGSAMRTMARFPFARIDGVELSSHLAAIAARNFQQLQMGKCRIFNTDAAGFTDFAPYNFVYLYNPFPAEIMERVMRNLIRSIGRSDREVIMIYNNPVYHEGILRQGRFHQRRCYFSEWGTPIHVYSNRPAGRLATGK